MTLPSHQMYREYGRPRSAQGYFFYGGNDLPIPPERLVFVDRANGTLWLLGVSPGLALQLTPPPSPLPTDITVYPAGEEPIVGASRVFAQSGQLKAEAAPRGVSTAPIILAVPGNRSQIGTLSVVANTPVLIIQARP